MLDKSTGEYISHKENSESQTIDNDFVSKNDKKSNVITYEREIDKNDKNLNLDLNKNSSNQDKLDNEKISSNEDNSEFSKTENYMKQTQIDQKPNMTVDNNEPRDEMGINQDIILNENKEEFKNEIENKLSEPITTKTKKKVKKSTDKAFELSYDGMKFNERLKTHTNTINNDLYITYKRKTRGQNYKVNEEEINPKYSNKQNFCGGKIRVKEMNNSTIDQIKNSGKKFLIKKHSYKKNFNYENPDKNLKTLRKKKSFEESFEKNIDFSIDDQDEKTKHINKTIKNIKKSSSAVAQTIEIDEK